MDRTSGILKEVFGYDSFRGFQREVIEHVVAGGDALVLMPTGGGKSLTYQIPALVRPGVGIVVSPLIALMADQVAALDELGVRAAALNSTLSSAEASALERRMRSGDIDLVYIAPERLLTDRCLQAARRPAGRRRYRALCDRRSALRVAVGARLPSGVRCACDPA